MFCGNCGGVCPDGSSTCPNCGSQLPPTLPPPVNPYATPYDAPVADTYAVNMGGPKPETYLTYSILSTVFTTLCCCFPLGIVPLIFSIIADNKWKTGDLNGTLSNANIAKISNWVCLGLIILRFVITFGFIVLGLVSEAMKH